MKIEDVEILIWSAEIVLTTIEKNFYMEIAQRLRKSRRRDLLERLQKIKPYEKKGEENGNS